jgi:hypothetical protein
VVAQRNPFYGVSVGRSKERGQKTKVSKGIQDIVEIAIWRLTGEILRTRSASRTDAGVHALGQVSVFETATPLSDEQVRKGLNTRLPQGRSLPIYRTDAPMSRNRAREALGLLLYCHHCLSSFLSSCISAFNSLFPSPAALPSSSPSPTFPIFLTLPLLHLPTHSHSHTLAHSFSPSPSPSFPLLLSLSPSPSPSPSLPLPLGKPSDVVIRRAETVQDSFDPRHCTGKMYRYTISCGPTRPVIGRDLCWHIKSKLDLEAMRAAAAFLVGRLIRV